MFDILRTTFRQNDPPKAGKITALQNATARFLEALKRQHGEAGDHYQARFECGILIAEKPGGDTGIPFQNIYTRGLTFLPSMVDEVQVQLPSSVVPWSPGGLVGCDDMGRIVQFFRDASNPRLLRIRTSITALRVECVVFGVRLAAE